jgi:hypothetical protein
VVSDEAISVVSDEAISVVSDEAIRTQSRGTQEAISDTRLGEQQPSKERERPIDDRVPAGRGPPDGTRGEMMTDAKELLAYDREHEGHERFAFAAEVEGL